MHNEQQVFPDELRLVETQVAQAFGTSPFHELEVVDVVDDAARVGVLVIDPTAMDERLSVDSRAHTSARPEKCQLGG
ncbi:hypothetical protein D3C77_647030 [compost metagenome]